MDSVNAVNRILFFHDSPFETSKKSKVIIAVITTLLLIVFTVAFFILIYYIIAAYWCYEGSDVWFIPLSMVFGVLGIMICYALTLFKLNPDKIKNINSKQKSNGLFHLLLHIFISLIGLVLKIVKAILKFKEKHVNAFIILATILLTWLIFFTAFIFAIICIAVLVGAIIMYFAGVIHWATDVETGSVIIDYNGEKLVLKRRFLGGNGNEELYDDEHGGIWYSDDGGKTVYKK